MIEWDKYNAVRLAIPFIIGMTMAHFLYPYCLLPMWVFVVGMVGSAIGFMLIRKDSIQGIAIHTFMLLLGFWLFQQAEERVEDSTPRSLHPFRAIVATPPQPKAHSVAVELDDEDTRILAYLQPDEQTALLAMGDTVTLLRPKFVPTSSRLNARDEGDSAYAAHSTYDDYLYYHGTSARCYVRHGEWMRLARERNDHEIGDLGFASLQRQALLLYARMGISGEEGAIVKAISLGEKQSLSRMQRTAFSSSGLSHLLALSGFHLTILVTLVNVLLLRSYLPWRLRRLMALLVIPALWAYAALTGFSPSLVRAVVMCSLLQVAFLLGREYSMLNALGMAAVVMLAVNPLTLLDVGFQLSFASMLAIGLMALPEINRLGNHGKIGSAVLSTFLITVSCTLFTMPLVAYYFGRVPVLSVLSNLVASLLATGLMWGCVGWWLLCGWAAAQVVCSQILLWLAGALQTVATTFGMLPAATIDFRPSVLEVVLLYVSLGAWLYYRQRPMAKPLIVALSAFLTVLLLQIFSI